MPSLHHRIANLERTATAQLPSSTEPITTLGEFLRVDARLAASSRHSVRSSPEEEARDKIDYVRLLEVFRNGVLLELAREFEEVYTTQGSAAAEQFLRESGLSVAESRRFREAWIPANQDPDDSQTNAGERR